MLVPWPSKPKPCEGEEEWDAAKGIGDWQARMERLYAAEAAEDDSTDDDDVDDDDAAVAQPEAEQTS